MFKKYLSYASFLFLGFSSYGQKAKFTIKGNFPEWNDRGPVVLMYRQNNQTIQDTAQVVKGKFTFQGKLQEPSRIAVYSIASVQGRTKDNISFYVDKGTVQLDGKDSLTHAEVKGSQFTNEGLQLKKKTDPIQKQMARLRSKAAELQKDDSYKTEIDRLNSEYKSCIDSLIAVKVDFIKQHPKSYLALLTVNEFTSGAIDYDFAYPLWNGLSADLKKWPLTKEIENKLIIAKRTSVGVILPDFTSRDTLRNTLSLMDVVQKGRYTLVDFWASWCLPCRKENPNIVKAYQTFHDKGFNILSVSLDKSEASWKNAIVQDGMPWYHVSSLQYWDEPVAKLYGISGVPDSFLVDSEGKVVARGLRAEALYSKLQELLN